MAMLNKNISTFIFFISILIGQNTKPTVAILDFEGQGVDASEVKTLSERMRTEIGNTNVVRLIERKDVEKIMMEQGLQQSGCTTDECAAEVGQFLGVQFMISGSITKMGKSYTIDCKMLSVETGESVTLGPYGPYDLYGEILSLDPPRALKRKRNQGVPGYSSVGTKRKTKTGALLRSLVVPGFGQFYSDRKLSAYSFMGVELALIGLAFNSQSTFNSLQSDQVAASALYDASTAQSDIETYGAQVVAIDADLQAANDRLALFSASAAGLWAINVIHAFITWPKDDLASLPITVAYDPVIKQTRLQWTVDF